PLIDIARMLLTKDGKIQFQAIVSNRPTDTFIKDTLSMEPLPAEAVAASIAKSRREGLSVMTKRMRELGLDDALAADVLHVFSAQVLFHRKGPLATPPHMLEIDRF